MIIIKPVSAQMPKNTAEHRKMKENIPYYPVPSEAIIFRPKCLRSCAEKSSNDCADIAG